MNDQIDWTAKRTLYYSPETCEAIVAVRGGFMELDSYREEGGRAESELPADAVKLGTFTNAQLSNMPYPDSSTSATLRLLEAVARLERHLLAYATEQRGLDPEVVHTMNGHELRTADLRAVLEFTRSAASA